MNGTGGGPPINKSLTDLEEKLLSLISKIHLGDTSLDDSLQIKETVPVQIGETEHNYFSADVAQNITVDGNLFFCLVYEYFNC